MRTKTRYGAPPARYAFLALLTLLLAAVWTAQSWVRWSEFGYTTFDLAFYVQTLDGFANGRNWSSILGVKPFGNHADFIILLILPFQALMGHPMTAVIFQNIALAACMPIGWKIVRDMGWRDRPAAALASLLILNPVLTFVALHEFHPEAFAAPLWLAVYAAWRQRRLAWYWLWVVLLLSCKENLGLMVLGWCFAKMLDRDDSRPFWKWIGFPAVFTVVWMSAYLFWLGPKWNAGNVDFGALYSHLRELGLWNGFGHALGESWRGAILWAVFLPMLLLPVTRPFTLLPAAPILMQHLLSWRSSEWTIYFHYAAPILPVVWIALVEALSRWKDKKWMFAMIATLMAANLACFGYMKAVDFYLAPFFARDPILPAKREFISGIPSDASVVAPLPYLSHLSQREEIYSLHLILKGLKTLSRERYVPPPPADYVLVDYEDSATFDSPSGQYHPEMRTQTGERVPSSDVLLHEYLARASWQVESRNGLTLWKQAKSPPANPLLPAEGEPRRSGLIDASTDLWSLEVSSANGAWEVRTEWSFRGERTKIPWMRLRGVHRPSGQVFVWNRGLVAPEGKADGRIWTDLWTLDPAGGTKLEDWDLEIHFSDNASRSYSGAAGSEVEVYQLTR